MAQDSAHCFRFVALLARLQEPVLRLFSSTAACRRAAWISLPTADSAFVSGAVQRRSVRRRRDDVDAYMFDTPQSPVYERKSRRGGGGAEGRPRRLRSAPRGAEAPRRTREGGFIEEVRRRLHAPQFFFARALARAQLFPLSLFWTL